MTTPPDPATPSRPRLAGTWRAVKSLWRAPRGEPDWDAELAHLRDQVPAPTFWLFGKTQSGKTSVVRFLTKAEDAAIGSGYRPCTRTSRIYPFPAADTPVLTFLDTRGVDEPGYDPAEDLAAFDTQAHLVLVTLRLADFAHGNLRAALAKVRAANPRRPVVLALTCLHESFPQQNHPQPYPFDPLAPDAKPAPGVTAPEALPPDLVRLVREQTAQFAGLVDRVVPIDLTRPEEGFADPDYGGPALQAVLLDSLPQALRATLGRVQAVNDQLKALHLKRAMPLILGYSTLAGTAGAIPVPFLDLVLLPAIQARMVQQIARLYDEPMTGEQFLSAVRTLGLGIVARQAVREVVKFIPFVGAPAGAALAGQATYALGLAFCEYFQAAHAGHVPSPAALKKLYQAQLGRAASAWNKPS